MISIIYIITKLIDKPNIFPLNDSYPISSPGMYLLRSVLDQFNKLRTICCVLFHDDVTKWIHFTRYWPFVKGIHRSPVDSPPEGQSGGTLMIFYLRLNKRLSKQSRYRWLEPPWRSLWRLCNAMVIHNDVMTWIPFPHYWSFSGGSLTMASNVELLMFPLLLYKSRIANELRRPKTHMTSLWCIVSAIGHVDYRPSLALLF